MSGPGAALFQAIQENLQAGSREPLPIMAEDLGVITPEVIELRERFGFPGMKILQFAFDQDALRASFGEHASSEEARNWRNPFLPHNYTPDCVAYTGSHDNDTALGWFEHATPAQRQMALDYLDCEPADFNWAMIRAVLASVAATRPMPRPPLPRRAAPPPRPAPPPRGSCPSRSPVPAPSRSAAGRHGSARRPGC